MFKFNLIEPQSICCCSSSKSGAKVKKELLELVKVIIIFCIIFIEPSLILRSVNEEHYQ